MKDSRVKGTRVYGNLHGASKSLSSGDLMKFANDVADGMHYISSQKVRVHARVPVIFFPIFFFLAFPSLMDNFLGLTFVLFCRSVSIETLLPAMFWLLKT